MPWRRTARSTRSTPDRTRVGQSGYLESDKLPSLGPAASGREAPAVAIAVLVAATLQHSSSPAFTDSSSAHNGTVRKQGKSWNMPFATCPHLAADVSHDDFWQRFHAEPRPYIIPGAAASDFVADYGRVQPNGDVLFEFGELGSASGRRYTLSNPGVGPYQAEVFSALPERFPLPAPLRSIDLTPMISVGLNGTGQTDLARHYHGVTAMRLLQGRKLWALRPPGDSECMANSGECTDPLDVCAFYARAAAPTPACVQEAGDTIVLPDG